MALRYKIFAALTAAIMFSPRPADAQPVGCQDAGGLRETPSIYFAAVNNKVQQSLIPENSRRSQWIELQLVGDSLVISNQMPGVGLPIDIFDINIDIIDELGQVYSGINTKLPLFGSCESVTLFPGQITKAFVLPFARADLPRNSRIRMHLWVNQN